MSRAVAFSVIPTSSRPTPRVCGSVQKCTRHRPPQTHACSVAIPIPEIPDDILTSNLQAHADAIAQSQSRFTSYGNHPACLNPPLDPVVAANAVRWLHVPFPKVAQPPPPFSATTLLAISQTPVLSKEECEALVAEAEAEPFGWRRAASARYGTPAHVAGGFLPIDAFGMCDFILDVLLPRLLPAVSNAFPGVLAPPADAALRLVEARLVKYDADVGHVELGYHYDGPLVTINVALTNPNAFDGGGTVFKDLVHTDVAALEQMHDAPPRYCVGGAHASGSSSGDCTESVTRTSVVRGELSGTHGWSVRLAQGVAMCHPGDVLHGGAAITRGVRHVLVLFLMVRNAPQCSAVQCSAVLCCAVQYCLLLYCQTVRTPHAHLHAQPQPRAFRRAHVSRDTLV